MAHGEAMVRGKVYFSGTLISSIFNFILIVVLGTHDEGADMDDREGYGTKRQVELPPASEPNVAHAV
jgi:hypothetical protein